MIKISCNLFKVLWCSLHNTWDSMVRKSNTIELEKESKKSRRHAATCMNLHEFLVFNFELLHAGWAFEGLQVAKHGNYSGSN